MFNESVKVSFSGSKVVVSFLGCICVSFFENMVMVIIVFSKMEEGLYGFVIVGVLLVFKNYFFEMLDNLIFLFFRYFFVEVFVCVMVVFSFVFFDFVFGFGVDVLVDFVFGYGNGGVLSSNFVDLFGIIKVLIIGSVCICRGVGNIF